MTGKNIDSSRTIMTELVLSSHVNGSGRLFGGQLMSWLDICGAICAKRHAECDVVTVKAEELVFHKPAAPNDVIVLTAEMISVGNTSMRVAIKAEVEPLGSNNAYTNIGGGANNVSAKGERVLTCSAVFTYVAIDAMGSKRTVPRLVAH